MQYKKYDCFLPSVRHAVNYVEESFDSKVERHKLEFVEKYIVDCIIEYEEKRKILYRAICDYISSMTDSDAINEYRKLLC